MGDFDPPTSPDSMRKALALACDDAAMLEYGNSVGEVAAGPPEEYQRQRVDGAVSAPRCVEFVTDSAHAHLQTTPA